jgi:hypothetical protein
VVDPHNFVAPNISIPGLEPPVREFSPTDDGDPSEVDAFNAMIRELRDQDRLRWCDPNQAETDQLFE